jgi:mannosyl-3-phosphoglycerate phosphatase
MMIVFTDLDGALLDRDTYSYAPAAPALAHLRGLGIPVVLVTSKTRAEVEALRTRMGNTDPFIVENGAAVIIPGAPDMVFGLTSAAAREALRRAADLAGVRVRGFGEMPLTEIRERTGLSPEIAALAAEREYGEPFVLLEGEVAPLEAALAALGFQMTRGGRFFHVLGGCDKARAVAALIAARGDSDTVGLGDAPNDVGFLRLVRRAVILPSVHLEAMRAALPAATVAFEPGPAGWNRAILDLFSVPPGE